MDDYGITMYQAYCKVCGKSVLMENKNNLIHCVSNSPEWHRDKQGLFYIECWNKRAEMKMSWWESEYRW